MCPLCVCWAYKLVAHSGDVLTQRQHFSIVDTHEPEIAMPLSQFCLHMMDSYPYKNQIFPVGLHQGVRRFVSPCLRHIKSIGTHCGTLHKKYTRRFGLVRFSRVRRRLFSICKPSKRWVTYWDRYPGAAWWRGEDGAGSMTGRLEDRQLQAGLFETSFADLSIPWVDGQSVGENSVLGWEERESSCKSRAFQIW